MKPLDELERAALEAAKTYVAAKQALIKAHGKKARQPLQIRAANCHLDLFAAVAALELVAGRVPQ